MWRLDGGCGMERAGQFDPSVDVKKVGGLVRSSAAPIVVGLARTASGAGLGWVDVESGRSGVVGLGRVDGCLTVPVVSESRAWVVAPAHGEGGTAFGIDLDAAEWPCAS